MHTNPPGSFIPDAFIRLVAVGGAATLGLAFFGASGSYLGGASVWRGAMRVLLGGWLAMAMTFGIGKVFGGGVPL